MRDNPNASNLLMRQSYNGPARTAESKLGRGQIAKSIDILGSGRSSPNNKLFNRNKETVEDLLVRKLKLKYIDNNPAFFNDAWANKHREITLADLANKSQSGFYKSLPNKGLGIEKYPDSRLKKTTVTFGGSSLPKIKGTNRGIDETRNDALMRKSIPVAAIAEYGLGKKDTITDANLNTIAKKLYGFI